MKLFLFEYATCGEKLEDSTAVEGLAMFKSAFEGFSKYYEINGFVRREYENLFQLPAGSMELMESYLERSDAFLIIAPENDFILYELTKKAEKFAENLGSSSKAIAITSDKWKLYKKLEGFVNVPETSLKPLEGRFLTKPRTGCAGEGIAFREYVPEGFIAQEYVEGLNLSVSIVVDDDVRFVSLNEQILDGFRYAGAVLPARVSEKVKSEVVEEAKKAVECIEGLKGYVGVDVVYSEKAYVIEINARFTTPAVAFPRAYGVSAADFIMGKEREFVRRQRIRKTNSAENYYVRVGNFFLEILDEDGG